MAGKPRAEAPTNAAPVFNTRLRLKVVIAVGLPGFDVVSLAHPLTPLCEIVRGLFLLWDYRSARRAAVNAKSAPPPRYVALCAAAALRAEGGGELRCRGLQCLRLLRLIGLSPDRARDAERADDLAGEILHRHGDAAHFEIEFALVVGDAGAPHLGDFTQQCRDFGDRLLGRGLELDTLDETLELVLAERGEHHLAERGAVCGPHDAHAVGKLE